MFKRWFTFFAAALFFSFNAGAQTMKQQLDVWLKDPNRAENAAKADVYLHRKKIISDTTQTTTLTAPQQKKKRPAKKQ